MEQAARARQARVDTSNATNPDFGLSKDALSLTYGESAAYIIVFGNKTSGVVNKSWVEYFFRESQPYHQPIAVLFSSLLLTLSSWNRV